MIDVPVQYYANGPRVPELNIDSCVSDDPGGTSGHVVEVRVVRYVSSKATSFHLFNAFVKEPAVSIFIVQFYRVFAALCCNGTALLLWTSIYGMGR
jgi:hypothetical protein